MLIDDTFIVYLVCFVLFFFFKQKTAYEIQYGLVGSEMCIRDRDGTVQHVVDAVVLARAFDGLHIQRLFDHADQAGICLLYTSDAADERSSVDLGGRRIIKKKKR